MILNDITYELKEFIKLPHIYKEFIYTISEEDLELYLEDILYYAVAYDEDLIYKLFN
jgi:hypothetical protein